MGVGLLVLISEDKAGRALKETLKVRFCRPVEVDERFEFFDGVRKAECFGISDMKNIMKSSGAGPEKVEAPSGVSDTTLNLPNSRVSATRGSADRECEKSCPRRLGVE